MDQQALLILGMHRSGTSALAGVLVRLGFDSPRTLMPPDSTNALGYWESVPIIDYHDRLLRELGTWWDAWTPLPLDWEKSQRATTLDGELARLVRSEFPRGSRFVVKDPRMCRFVPFWLRNLQAMSIPAAAVLVVRSPADVASSLAARDGLLPEFSLLMWLRHMLEAEYGTRSTPRSIIRYRDLLDDGRRVMTKVGADLGFEWTCSPEAIDTAVAQSVRPELCHHADTSAAVGVNRPLTDWVNDACAAFELLLDGDDAARREGSRRLDDIRVAFDAAAATFGHGDEALRQGLHEHAAALEAERTALKHHVANLQAHNPSARERSHSSGPRCRRTAGDAAPAAIRAAG